MSINTKDIIKTVYYQDKFKAAIAAMQAEPVMAYLAKQRWGNTPYFVNISSIRQLFAKRRKAQDEKDNTDAKEDGPSAGTDASNVERTEPG